MAISKAESDRYALAMEGDVSKCPRCGSDDIELSDYDGDREMSRKAECVGCGLTWVEIYQFQCAFNFAD